MRFDSTIYRRAAAAVAAFAAVSTSPTPTPAPIASPGAVSAVRAAVPAAPVAVATGQPTGIERAIDLAADLCRRFEGFESKAYLCAAGVPTIGWGSTRYLDGRRVTLNDRPISREAADRLLELELRRLAGVVLALCPGAISTPERLAALLSWTYNLGETNLRASSMRRAINAGDWAAAKRELVRWVYAKGRRLAGLVKRRAAEAALL